MTTNKTIIVLSLILFLYICVTSCEIFAEKGYFFYFQNHSDTDIMVGMVFNPSDSLVFDDYDEEYLVRKKNYYKPTRSKHNTWEKYVKDSSDFYIFKVDSVQLWSGGECNYDNCMMEEFLIAKMRMKLEQFWDVNTYEADTAVFPPSPDSGIPIVYYNGYTPSSVSE